MKKECKSLLWGFLAGGVAGSVTALLLAPKPGKELRKDIAEGASSTIDKVQELAVQAGDKSVELYEKAKDAVGSVVSEVREWGKQHASTDGEEKLSVSGLAADEAAAAGDDAGEVIAQYDKDLDDIVV